MRSASPSPIEDVALAVLQRQADWMQRGRSAVSILTGRSQAFVQWQHYPAGDAMDRSGRWQFYYHAHDDQRVEGEHGHVHLFRRGPDAGLAHVAALSLNDRGAPLAWFTTNLWVTGGQWLSARALSHQLHSFSLQIDGPLRGVANWLTDLVTAHRVWLRELLQARDEALELHCRTNGQSRTKAWRDRQLGVLSTRRLSWPADALPVT